MAENENVTSATTSEEPVLKSTAYRVLKRDDNVTRRWLEVGPLSGAGPYGFHPTARDFGELAGAGEYLYWDAAEAYASYVRKIKVVAETAYLETDDDSD